MCPQALRDHLLAGEPASLTDAPGRMARELEQVRQRAMRWKNRKQPWARPASPPQSPTAPASLWVPSAWAWSNGRSLVPHGWRWPLLCA